MYSFKTLHAYYPSIDTDVKETYIVGDFNINMYENNKYILYEKKTQFAQNLHPLMPKSTINIIQ